MLPKLEILPCCGHSLTRHIRLVDDDPKTAVCLTGFCKCGLPKIKKQGRAKRSSKPWRYNMSLQKDGLRTFEL